MATEAQKAEFRKHYLLSGNRSAAARAVGISPWAGFRLAKECNADADFVAARQEMYTSALRDAEQMMLSAIETAMERFEAGAPDPMDIAKRAQEYGLKSFVYQDNSPQYLKGIVDAFKALTTHRKIAAEQDAAKALHGDGKVDVVVHLKSGPDEVPIVRPEDEPVSSED